MNTYTSHDHIPHTFKTINIVFGVTKEKFEFAFVTPQEN